LCKLSFECYGIFEVHLAQILIYMNFKDTALQRQHGWAIAHFENVQLLFLTCKKSAISKFTLFCTFLLIGSLCDPTFYRNFEKCDCTIALLKRATKKCNHKIALFKRATKECDRTIALFKRATKKCDCTIALFKRATKKWDCSIARLKKANVQKKCGFLNVQIAQQAGLGNRPFWKCMIALFKSEKMRFGNHNFYTFLHIRPFQKNNCAIALFKVWKSRILKFALFRTFLDICSFWKSDCEIALFLHSFKEPQKVRSHICTFSKSNKKFDCTFAHF